jgi:hypothetical protein
VIEHHRFRRGDDDRRTNGDPIKRSHIASNIVPCSTIKHEVEGNV